MMKDWSNRLQILVAVSFLCAVAVRGTQMVSMNLVNLVNVFTVADYVNQAIPIMFVTFILSLVLVLPFVIWNAVVWLLLHLGRRIENSFGRRGVIFVKIVRITLQSLLWLALIAFVALMALVAALHKPQAGAASLLIGLVVLPVVLFIVFKRSLRHYPLWNVVTVMGAPLLVFLAGYLGYATAGYNNYTVACKLVSDGRVTTSNNFAPLERGLVMVNNGEFTLVPWDHVSSVTCVDPRKH